MDEQNAPPGAPETEGVEDAGEGVAAEDAFELVSGGSSDRGEEDVGHDEDEVASCEDDTVPARYGELGAELVNLYARHTVSQAAMEEIIALFRKAPYEEIKTLPTFKTLRQNELVNIPPAVIDYAVRNDNGGGHVTEYSDEMSVPRRLLSQGHKLLWTLTRVSLRDILAFHRGLHAGAEAESRCSIAADNVPLCKNSRK